MLKNIRLSVGMVLFMFPAAFLFASMQHYYNIFIYKNQIGSNWSNAIYYSNVSELFFYGLLIYGVGCLIFLAIILPASPIHQTNRFRIFLLIGIIVLEIIFLAFFTYGLKSLLSINTLVLITSFSIPVLFVNYFLRNVKHGSNRKNI